MSANQPLNLPPETIPPEICAIDEQSFAAHTLRHRLPHIVEQIISDNTYSADQADQLRALVDEVLEGTIVPFQTADAVDAERWAIAIQDHVGKSWFAAPFFFVEMYFYRRIAEIIHYADAFEQSMTVRAEADPFQVKKQQGFEDAIPQANRLAIWLNDVCKPDENSDGNHQEIDQLFNALETLLLANLWSNRADLSQLPKWSESDSSTIYAEQSDKLLIDNSAQLKTYLLNQTEQQNGPLSRVDIILDNTGIELISDLALADFFLSQNIAHQVILHAKRYPVFVSDAMVHDIAFTIEGLCDRPETPLHQWGQRLHHWRDQQRLVIQDHPFWTLPLYFRAMTPDLLEEMQHSSLWICKGDANYRRLLDDRHWDISTPIDSITSYLPVPCLALRVLKCELLAGMDVERVRSLSLDPDWMTNGTYGIIQFAPTGKTA